VEAHLAPDALVLLYSDGAVERPGRTSVQNTLDLARVVGDVRRSKLCAHDLGQLEVDRICEGTMEVLTRVTGYSDDITLLAAQRVPATAPLSLRLPATAEGVRRARRELGSWLEMLHPRDLDQGALLHAAGELVVNAVEHAYAATEDPDTRTIDLRAVLDGGGDVEVSVHDRGRWRAPDPAHSDRGRGLAMASGLVDSLSVEPGEDGTRACVRHRLSRSAGLLVGRQTPGHEAAAEFALDVDAQHRRVAVRGVVDEEASGQLFAALRHVVRGGTVDATLDLSGVTQLPSVGVRVLFEMREEMQGGHSLTIVAPPGSPAQHVLDIVGLGHTGSGTALDELPPLA
jgi:anti-sigma regulatory factor (Ser/Thr protein kinase)/anti-anti-sigma regulatory factor